MTRSNHGSENRTKQGKFWLNFIHVLFTPFRLFIGWLIATLVSGNRGSSGVKMTSKVPIKPSDNAEQSENMPEAIREIRRCHKQAYAYIAKALNIDETGANCDAKEKAIDWYKRGIDELNRGVNISCTGEGQEWERARSLQEKMIINIKSTSERMNELVTLVQSQSGTPENKVVFKKSKSKLKEQPTALRKSLLTNQNGPSTSVNRVSSIGQPRVNRSRSNDKLNPTSRRDQRAPQVSRSTSQETSSNMDELRKTQRRKVLYLKNIDSKIANRILDEVVQNSPDVTFDDVAGMESAKQILKEIVILPALRPELFTGLRAPARGLLLYGPPGNGKTMLAKAVSHQAKATFFNISAATLTSKWVGEGEKLVRALFAVARELQPSIIFIDEIDSLLCERKEGEQESSRRMKTEFLTAFDGLTSGENERILLMGATNRPQELDDAALRRLVKRVYLPLPDKETRKILLSKLLEKHHSPLTEDELERLAGATEHYSGSDLTALARDAALGPIREMAPDQLQTVEADKVRNINFSDFVYSMKNVRASVSPETLRAYQEWTKIYGTSAN